MEVLRGPQGTLFGKNTIAGAVNIITRKPAFEDSAVVTPGLGNLNSREAAFVGNVREAIGKGVELESSLALGGWLLLAAGAT